MRRSKATGTLVIISDHTKMYADKSIYLLSFIDFYVHPHNRLIYTKVYISIKIYVHRELGKPGG